MWVVGGVHSMVGCQFLFMVLVEGDMFWKVFFLTLSEFPIYFNLMKTGRATRLAFGEIITNGVGSVELLWCALDGSLGPKQQQQRGE